MKWLIGVFAALMVTSAQAGEQDLAWTAKQNQCRIYRGSWTNGQERAHIRPTVACRFTDGVGVLCVVKDHELPGAPTLLGFRGDFMDNGSSVNAEDLTNPEGGPLMFSLLCSQDYGCLFRLWNNRNLIGYSCNLGPVVEKAAAVPAKPKAPPPEPPALLKRPTDTTPAPVQAPFAVEKDGSYKL